MVWNILAWIVTFGVGWILGWMTWRRASGGTVRVIDTPDGDDDVYVQLGSRRTFSTWLDIDGHTSVEVDPHGHVVALRIASINRWFQRCHGEGYRVFEPDVKPPASTPLTTYRFIAQTWVNDQVLEVDPLGEDSFEAPKDISDEDRLREYAPKWAREWPGPWTIRPLE
jgi:hypothetical protein